MKRKIKNKDLNSYTGMRRMSGAKINGWMMNRININKMMV